MLLMVGHRLDAGFIRNRRTAKGWSQEHLAQAAGIHEKTIRRAEAGERVSGETRLAIASALDVRAEALAAGESFVAAPHPRRAVGRAKTTGQRSG
jgi:transcriptional regulator with XRE-family HTH domain